MTLAEVRPREGVRFRRARSIRFAGAVVSCWLASVALGADIRVRVVDGAGDPLPDTAIRLAVDDGIGDTGMTARTGPDGLAVFRDLLPGRFVVTSDAVETAFVRPEHTFPSSSLHLAIDAPNETRDARLVLVEGRRVFLHFAVARTAQRHWGSVVAINIDTRQRVVVRVDQDDEHLLTLVPGRWNMSLTPPPGLLLSDLRLNGNAVGGHQVNLDLRGAFATARLGWRFDAPARITGRVTVAGVARAPTPIDVRASLLRPGPWFDDARRRGGSEYTTVKARVDPATGEFVMELPAGRWKLAARDASGRITETSTHEIDLLDGEERRSDFALDWPLAEEVVQEQSPAAEPAAATGPVVSARFYCLDGTLLPRQMDVRVFAADDADVALLATAAVPLSGELRDRVAIRPPRATAAVLAVRPVGFDRWTTTPYETPDAGPADLGPVAIDCTPLLRLSIGVLSGRPSPDLRGTDRERILEIEGTIRPPGGRPRDVEDFRLEASREALTVHGLPLGEADLRVRVGSRFFLPGYWVDVPVDGVLARGRTLDVTGVVAEVGGTVAVRASAGVALRLVADDGEEQRTILRNGTAAIANVAAGTYRLELCSDTACRTLLHTWPGIEVDALETTELTWPAVDSHLRRR